jgi:hypothetical protein
MWLIAIICVYLNDPQLRDFAIRFSLLLDLKLGVLEDLDEFDHFSDSSCLALMKGMLEVLSKDSLDKVISSVTSLASWLTCF